MYVRRVIDRQISTPILGFGFVTLKWLSNEAGIRVAVSPVGGSGIHVDVEVEFNIRCAFLRGPHRLGPETAHCGSFPTGLSPRRPIRRRCAKDVG